MNAQLFTARLRGFGNSILLNRLVTSCHDLIIPARSLGEKGERIAGRYLRCRGHIIVARGYQDSGGELDIVTVDQRTVVFVEVKTRSATSSEAAFAAIDVEKQGRITNTAHRYLKRHDLLDSPRRFDVIAVCWPDKNKGPKIEHLTNAFQATT